MSLPNRLALPFALAALAVLAGCGSSTNTPTAPPSGGFSDTNFSGTYTFSVEGEDGNGIFAMAGTLVACGCTQGTISSGTVDLVDPTGVAAQSTIGSNSTYSVSADGRGLAKLMITTSGGSEQINLDFVLTSSSHGLVSRYDSAGTGSGTIDLQPSVISQASVASTPYAFSVSGGDFIDTPLASVGSFTLDASGNITTAIEDFNYGGTPTTALPLTGSVTVGSGTTPGVASLLTAFDSNPLTFDVYTIDATHLKVIEVDGQAIMVGDVFTASSAGVPQGNLAFSMSGLDTSGALFATGGLMASDGASQITSGSEDINDDGVVDAGTNPATPFTFGGTFIADPSGSGRYQFTLSGYQGGTNFAAYPSSAGLLMMEVDPAGSLDVGIDNAGVTSGMAVLQQSGAGVTASAGYGLNSTGESTGVNSGSITELDEIAEFKTTSSSISGLIDVNDFTVSLNTSNLTGSYTAGSNGTGTATFSSGGMQEIFYYSIDGSTSLFINADPSGDQATLGSFEIQTTPTSNAASPVQHPHVLPSAHTVAHGKSALRKGGHHLVVYPKKAK